MLERCPSSREFGRGFLRDYRLMFTNNSVKMKCGTADVIRSSNDVVWGMVYTMTKGDLDALSKKEGTNYQKTQRQIEMDHRILPAVWVYEVVNKGQFKPSPAYLNIIKNGARRLNFPESYLEMLNRVETEERS